MEADVAEEEEVGKEVTDSVVVLDATTEAMIITMMIINRADLNVQEDHQDMMMTMTTINLEEEEAGDIMKMMSIEDHQDVIMKMSIEDHQDVIMKMNIMNNPEGEEVEEEAEEVELNRTEEEVEEMNNMENIQEMNNQEHQEEQEELEGNEQLNFKISFEIKF